MSDLGEILQNCDFLAAAVAVIAMLMTLWSARKAHRLQRIQVRNEYLTHVREWASEVVKVMSESITACELDPKRACDFFTLRNDLRTHLSELIDRGRWFYENTEKDKIGQWKEGAFSGLATDAISAIKKVHKLVESLDYTETAQNPEKRQLIVDEKRKFVSEIQRLLKPSAMAAELD